MVSIELSSAEKDNVGDNVKVVAITSLRSISQKDGEEDTSSVHYTPVRNVDDNVKLGTINSVRSLSQKDGEEDTVFVNTPPAKEVDAFNIEKWSTAKKVRNLLRMELRAGLIKIREAKGYQRTER